MDAKTYLRQPEVLERRIDSKLALLRDLRALAEKTGYTLSEVVVTRTRNNHPMADVVDRIVDLQEEINRDTGRLAALKIEIRWAIDSIPDPRMQEVLEMRYLGNRSWEEIAEEMECTSRRVFTLHAQALRIIRVPDARADTCSGYGFVESVQ